MKNINIHLVVTTFYDLLCTVYVSIGSSKFNPNQQILRFFTKFNFVLFMHLFSYPFSISVPLKPKLEPGCKDYEPTVCKKWAEYGECKRTNDARKYCPKSCRICGDKKPTIEPPSLGELMTVFVWVLREGFFPTVIF